ncbi:phage tail tube protein [Reyranella sp.]|uniref:phage tail tube protein n=1 Tax=Reyranella sp. TaxID=1929291 RepID=UPI00272F9823|nr:phage tail tube protein [Reyranella sp.]MDP2377785.1 phage tail tube protein [Reyranella sp.]
MAWDGAQKQDAIIAESVRNTTPSTPTFLLTPAMTIGGRPDRPQVRARSRQAHRSAVNLFQGLTSFPKTIDMDLAYEVSTQLLLSSVFMGAWSSDVVKFGSAMQPFTLEEKYGGAAIYRRTTGCICDSLQMSARLGDAVRLNFSLKALGESTATAAIASSTYTAIAGGKPFTPANFVINDAFGVSAPKVQAIDLTFRNNSADLYAFGSNDPDDTSLGEVDVSGTISLRFTALAQYTAFLNSASGALDVTMGHTTAEKYQLLLPNACAYNPDIIDPGSTGPHTVTVEVMGKYDAATENTVAKLTRAVA